MDKFERAATDRSPEISFDFANHHLRIKGESYPEDVNAFYGPVLEALERYLQNSATGHAGSTSSCSTSTAAAPRRS